STDSSEITVKLGAGVAPNFTPVAPVKLTPVIVTVPPPAVLPMLGLTEVTAGSGSPNASMCSRPAETLAALPKPLTATGTELGEGVTGAPVDRRHAAERFDRDGFVAEGFFKFGLAELSEGVVAPRFDPAVAEQRQAEFAAGRYRRDAGEVFDSHRQVA